jgi:hypothetical protein
VDDPGYADLVRRDVRAFVASAVVLVAALAVMTLWRIDVLGSTGRAAAIGLGLISFLVSFFAWATHDRRIRERLFVLGPGTAAALPIGLGMGGPQGLMVSFALCLLATWAWALSRQRRT